MTRDKEETIEQGRDLISHWAHEIADNPDKFYLLDEKSCKQSIFDASEIFTTLNGWLKDNNHQELRVSPNSFARYLSAIPTLPYKRVRIQLPSGKWVTKGLYALRNREMWSKKSAKINDWRKEFVATSASMKKSGEKKPGSTS
jgi:hypothetical protein